MGFSIKKFTNAEKPYICELLNLVTKELTSAFAFKKKKISPPLDPLFLELIAFR